MNPTKCSLAKRTSSVLAPVALCLSMTACSVLSAVSPQAYLDNLSVRSVNLAAVAPGTYTGDYTLALPPGMYAKNRHFNVTVTITGAQVVTVTKNEPTSLSAVGASATDELNANLDAMIGRIEAAKAIPVDDVSGATYSSRAFQKAVEKAVTQ